MAHDQDSEQAELQQAYAGYRAAMAAWRAAAKARGGATTDEMDDRLLQARVTLYRALVRTGWDPPDAVEVQLERDIALVEAPQDFDALLASA